METITRAAIEVWVFNCPTRKRRAWFGIAQKQLAWDAKVCIATLQAIEMGVSQPQDGTIRKIAEALEVRWLRLKGEIKEWRASRPTDATAMEYLEKEKLRDHNETTTGEET